MLPMDEEFTVGRSNEAPQLPRSAKGQESGTNGGVRSDIVAWTKQMCVQSGVQFTIEDTLTRRKLAMLLRIRP
jgi:hypothetical protein